MACSPELFASTLVISKAIRIDCHMNEAGADRDDYRIKEMQPLTIIPPKFKRSS